MTGQIDRLEQQMKPALKYAERAERGLPSDRWASGVEGERDVASGIRAMAEIIHLQAAVLEVLWAETHDAQRRTSEGLEPSDTS
jgi:hypothetical protein